MSSSNKSLEALIAQYASISKTAFRATAGVFYGIAVLSVLARGVIRFTTRRNLALDDYLLFAAFAFLTTVTALCWSPTKNTLYVSMTGLVTGLDALTDILIVSIPIIVLYRARMRTSQKISLGIFLCLSLVMVCLAIIRASKVHGAVSIDVVWVFFWQYMETVVAVIMGSLTVVRNLLVHQTKSNHNSPAAPGGSGGRNPRAAYRMGLLRRHKEKNIDNSTRGLPEVPAPTLSGLRTFIRRNNRDPGLDTQATQASTLVQDETYYMAPSIEQSRIDPEEQGWEHHQHIYQTPPRTRARVWGSLQGDSTIQPSMTTTCTSTTLNDRDHY
ncbi:hypothetical protein J7T55_008628 [Diaporthe amygdali]|uniref:uncharacterized protein n=1 Tax=Phomopsis amygdali TaxID=1214568 RepID=UPI0022FE2062|nr:uncharacterized protein J7T55_008628 [Diaporthe amygdali]KAJ0121464.1 hypothetical protein J7T55_008628 [Diaporthe amygdali]